MDRDKPSFPDALRDLRERWRHRLMDHPSVEMLAAYHEDRVSPAEQEALREHLTLCSECRGLVLDLARFDELGRDEEGEPVGRDLDSAWGALHARLNPLPARPATPRWAAGGWRSWSPARARLAAGLFLAVLGFASGWTAARLRGSSEFQVQADIKQIPLSPEEESLRGDEQVASIRGDLQWWTLLLDLPTAADDKVYEAVIERDGRTLLRQRLHEDSGILSLGMERSSWPPGDYQVLLFPVSSPQQSVATYKFKVQR